MRNIIKNIFLVVLLAGSWLPASGQGTTVTGTVVESGTNMGIIGTNVTVQGTTIGVNTDINGRYEIRVPGPDAVLVFSYLGYTTQEETVGERTVINVELSDDALTMEQVVVVGYGTQKKESISGAIATLSPDNILSTPASNMTQAISGKIPGLITSQGQGQPSYDDAEIFIRGRATFAGDAQPLVLVDGVERSFTQVNPEDVAQISVLKDASATAVYGVRGANGVILVTTKRGFEGKPEVSFSANFSLQTPTYLNKYLNSYNSVVLYEEALANDGLNSEYSPYDIEMFRKSVTGQLSGYDLYRYPNVDWYKEALKKAAPSQQYNVNVTGGTRRMRYFTSLSYFDQHGLYKPQTNDDFGQSSNARFQRYTFRANLDFLLHKYFTLSINFGTRFEETRGPNVTENRDYNELFYELNRTPGWQFPVQWPDGRWGGNAFAQKNAVALLSDAGFYRQTANTYETNAILLHDMGYLTQGLTIRAMGSFDYYTDHRKNFSKSFAVYDVIDRQGDLDDLDNFYQFKEDGLLQMTSEPQYTSLKSYLEVGVNYERRFNDTHNVTALLLYNQNHYRYQADIPTRYQGLVGRLTYDYKSRYFAEANFGYNGSENFAKGRRFGFFPSFAASWMISNEEFMNDVTWLDVLKLMGSYGEVGNDKYNDARFLYLTGWTQNNNTYYFGDAINVNGVTEGTYPNLYVTWERAKKSNIALEGSLGRGLFSFTTDFFYEKRSDILSEYQSRASWLAVNQAPANLGKVTNKGLELQVNHRNNIGDFSYFVGGSYSIAKNKIDYMDEPQGKPSWRKLEGRVINQFFGYIVDGYVTSADLADPNFPTYNTANGKGVQVGDLKYRDMNDDGVIDERDVAAIGYSDIPEYTYTFSLGGDWKGISFSVMFQGVGNVSRFYGAEAQFAFVNGGKARKQHLDRWNPNMSEEYNLAHAKYPLLHVDDGNLNNQRLNSFFLKNASFLRLKNVEISYNLPKRIANKVFTQDIRVYVNANNLVTWDKNGGIADPESKGANIYPIMRVFNLGVNIKF